MPSMAAIAAAMAPLPNCVTVVAEPKTAAAAAATKVMLAAAAPLPSKGVAAAVVVVVVVVVVWRAVAMLAKVAGPAMLARPVNMAARGGMRMALAARNQWRSAQMCWRGTANICSTKVTALDMHVHLLMIRISSTYDFRGCLPDQPPPAIAMSSERDSLWSPTTSCASTWAEVAERRPCADCPSN